MALPSTTKHAVSTVRGKQSTEQKGLGNMSASYTSRPIHVFVDTSTIAEAKFRLDWPPIRALLAYALEGDVVLHTTLITLHEIEHVYARKLRMHAQKIRESKKFFDEAQGIRTYSEQECAAKARGVRNAYQRACAHCHSGNTVSCDQVIDRYIRSLPPFSKDKPDEFKDALAVLALQSWAIRNDSPIVVIADDGDWHSVCADNSVFRKLSIGELLGLVEKDREELMMSLSESDLLDFLNRMAIDEEVIHFLPRAQVTSNTDSLLSVEDLTFEHEPTYHLDSVEVLSSSSIRIVAYFSADVEAVWDDAHGNGSLFDWGDYGHVEGFIEVDVTPDFRILNCDVQSMHIYVSTWMGDPPEDSRIVGFF